MLVNVTGFGIDANVSDALFLVDFEGGDFVYAPGHPLHKPRAPQGLILILQIVFGIVGVFSDLLIMYITLRCKRSRNKTNLIIANIVFLDAVEIVVSTEMIRIVHQTINASPMHWFTVCSLTVFDCSFHAGAFVFVIVLLSNWLMEWDVRTLKIIAVVYTLLFLAVVANTLGCAFLRYPLSYLFWTLVFVLALTLALAKEINGCYMMLGEDPVSERVQFRKNVARIYLYNWFVAACCLFLFHGPLRPWFYVWDYLRLTRYISGLYVLIYLACQTSIDYSIDATVTFAKDDNVDVSFNQDESG